MQHVRFIKQIAFIILSHITFIGVGHTTGNDPVPLKKLESQVLAETSGAWKSVGTVWFDPLNKKRIVLESGDGILYNGASRRAQPDPLPLLLGDGESVYLEFEYMLSPDATLQLGWGRGEELILSAGGGFSAHPATNGALVGDTRHPPRVDASRAAGLWQRGQIWLSSGGEVKGVKLNDILVHRGVHLPSSGARTNIWELYFQSDHPVAIRHIQYAMVDEDNGKTTSIFEFPTRRRIIVTPTESTIVQRCFILDGISPSKRTYSVAVGDPNGIHYAVDQAQANLLGVWRGEFFDATTMWVSRGELQVAQPLGNIVWFDGKPLVAELDNPESAWPDSAQHGHTIKGYDLDKEKRPVFHYLINGMSLQDRVTPIDGFRAFERTLTAKGIDAPNVWLRLASGVDIRDMGKGRYVIDDMKYYLTLSNPRNTRAHIRKVNGVSELLVSVPRDLELTYSVYW